MNYRFIICVVATVIGLVSSPMCVRAAEAQVNAAKRDVLVDYVNDDTLLVAHLSVSKLGGDKPDDARLSAIVPQLADSKVVSAALGAVDAVITQLRGAGVDELYCVAGLADINVNGGPLWILTLAPDSDPIKVKQTLAPLLAAASPWVRPLEMRPIGEGAVLVGKPGTLDRYLKLQKSDRPDVLGPLAKLADDGAVAAAVFCPGPDYRRVTRELWPQLPGPLAELRGDIVGEWQHFELAVNPPPDSKPRLTLQARSAAGAEIFQRLWAALPAAIDALPKANDDAKKLSQQVAAVVYAATPQQDDTRVTITLPTDNQQLGDVQPLVGAVVDAAMESAHRDVRMTRFRQLALAMHNYESAEKHLPASAAIRSPDGKPLLSWRVAILPFLDGGMDRYKQFHLDEPWDSPHNRTLIERMPGVFSDPDRKVANLNREGKTTYVVPVAPETMFDQTKEYNFNDVTDGTSRTIMLVEVEPSHAVVWTRPEDWNVNVQEPMRELKRKDRKGFIAAFADGHIEVIRLDVEWQKVRGLLTKSGGELFDWP
jgi:hypothetical protein